MIESYIGVFEEGNRENITIVELTQRQIALIAQALHIYREDNPDSDLVNETIHSLIDQAHNVYNQPFRHNVYRNGLQAPKQAKVIGTVTYTPVD